MTKDMDHLQKAQNAWGDRLPQWVAGLARECNAVSSQSKVARTLGVSPTQVSQVIGNKYKGNTNNLRDRYMGVYEAEVVECPALGRTPLDVCRDWRAKSTRLQSANAQNVMMFRACNRCPLNKDDGGVDA